jgi:SAM-dependent methyltransferase
MSTAVGRDRPHSYQRSRPSYPDDVVAFARAGLRGRTAVDVADVGCGAGLSLRPFATIASSLVGVEPDEGMRAVATEALSDLGARIMAGSAEGTGLDDCSVDLLIAASCFEWFDLAAAAREFRRVLRPSGRVLLMWNHRAVVDEVSFAFDQLWLRHMGPRVGPHLVDIESLLVPSFLHQPFQRFRRVVLHDYDGDRLLQFAQSSGYAPTSAQPRRWTALAEAMAMFYARYAIDGHVRLCFETVAFLGTPRAGLSRPPFDSR